MKILKQSFYGVFTILFICLMNLSYAVELNSASAQQLMSLKGIGEKTAQAILQERQRAGPFVSLEDFSIRVKGIGKKRLEKLVTQGLHIQLANLPTSVSNDVGKAVSGIEISASKVEQSRGASSRSPASAMPATIQASSSINRSRTKQLKSNIGHIEIAEPKLIKPPKLALPPKP